MSTLVKLKRSAVRGKVPTTVQLELGELALNTVDGNIYFKTEDSSSVQAIHTLRELTAGVGLNINDSNEIDLVNTGVTSGSYGSASEVPVLSINDQGQVTSASSVTVAGVTSLVFDSSNGELTINTADGDSHSAVLTLDPYTTANLVEGSNLYYTTARADSDFDVRLATKTTNNLTEGTNLYYTQTRFNNAFLAKTTDSLSEGPLNLYYTTARADSDFDIRLATKSTTDLSEGVNLYYTTARHDSDFSVILALTSTDSVTEGSTNLYYTTARADSDFDVRLATKSTTDVAEGTNLYHTPARVNTLFDTRLGTKTTTDLAEGNNLYYTTARHDSDFSVILALTSTDSVSEGTTNLYHTPARVNSLFDTRLGTKTTTNLAEGTNLYYTTARADSDARSALLAIDAGGDGSFTYDSATGAFTFTGPSASETRAHFSGGTGVTITNGSIAIDQSVATDADVQFGKVTVDSAQVDCLHLTKLAGAPNSLRGLLYYDSDPQSGLSFIPTTNELVEDVTINIGQETVIYVHNLTGEQINNGDAVYISGTAHGAHPQVSKAKADAASTARPIGVATMDIPNGNHGYVTKVGLVRGLNTAGLTEGATAYLSADSAGKWGTNEVTIEAGFPTHLGTVIAVDSSEGSLLVNVEAEHFEYLKIQDNVIVGDSVEAHMLHTNYVDLKGLKPAHNEGRIFYDSAFGALAVYNDEADITLQVGQEDYIRVYNSTDSDIPNGTPVYLVGENNGVPTIAPAQADTEGLHEAVGFATHDIETLSTGYVTVRGLIADVDTSHLTAGSRVHLGVSGGTQTAAPTYPYFATDMGICLISDSSAGCIYVNVIEHSFETIRVTDDARFDANVTIGGNLTVLGSQSQVSVANLATENTFIYTNSGDTIGDTNTQADSDNTGLDDLTLTGHYEGTTSSKTFYVEIDGTGGTDTFKWWTNGDSASPEATGVSIDTNGNTLADNIKATFNAATGHTVGDRWFGTASPVNVDIGLASNRNTGTSGVGYTHLGIFFDVTDEKWKLFDAYDPEPEGAINTADSSYSTATLVANIEGNLTGNVTGNASTASQLLTSNNIRLVGDITGVVAFDGSDSASLTTAIAANSIVNADINATAGIVDTKLATISTAGKVQNSATTATANNTASTIVARDGSGNFTAGTITATLTGTADNATELDNQGPSYYLDHTNFTNAPSAFTKFKIGTLDTFEPDSANDILELATGPGIVFSVDSANDKLIIDTKSTTPLVTDLYSAGSGQTAFTMSKAPTSENEMMVFVEGVYQNKNSYSIAGSTLTLSDSVATGSEVVVHQVGSNLVSGDVTFGQAVSGTRMFSFTSASQQTVCTFDATTYRSLNLQVQVTDHVDSSHEMSQVHLIHDGTTATTTEFGTIYTGDSDLGDFDASISGSDLDILFTPNNGNNKTIKLHFNAIKV